MRVLLIFIMFGVGFMAFREWQMHDNDVAFVVMNVYVAVLCAMFFLDLKKLPAPVKTKKQVVAQD